MNDQRANAPTDQIDPYESQLTRRVGAYSEQAVQPIDAYAVASTAVAGAERRGGVSARLFGSSGATARLGLIGAGALLAVAGVVVIGGGANGLFPPAQTAIVTAAPVAAPACTPYDVDAVITAWDGAAGHRIATVELRQIGTSECTVAPLPQPWLAGGHGVQLVLGHARAGAAIAFAPGEVLHTLVQVGNYCGPAPDAPVTVAFNQDSGVFVATALTPTDMSGLPPCNGTAGPTDDITMHPWER